MLLVVASVDIALGDAWPAPVSLALQVGSGALCYGLLLRVVHRDELAELIGLLPRASQQLLLHALLMAPGACAEDSPGLPRNTDPRSL
jgi:hypothetical protein